MMPGVPGMAALMKMQNAKCPFTAASTMFIREYAGRARHGGCCEKKSGRVDERKNGRTILFHSSTPPFLHSIFIRDDAVRRTGMEAPKCQIS
jgi:hypothetical protein